MPKVTFVPREVAETMPEDGELMVSIAHPGDINKRDCWPLLDHWRETARQKAGAQKLIEEYLCQQ